MKDAILQKSKLYDDDVAPDAAQSQPAWQEWRQPCYPVERTRSEDLRFIIRR